MNALRKGRSIQTHTGRQFWTMDPRPDEVEIEDIAHALSMICRFGGHCLRFYSVAEHCVLMARAVSPENALWALLHDAGEAYLTDVPRPVKQFLPGYKEAEEAVMAAICERFGLPLEMPAEVKAADSDILADETMQNMARASISIAKNRPLLGVTLQFWTPEQAKAEFLAMFAGLTGEPACRWCKDSGWRELPEDAHRSGGVEEPES